ncbi:MAG TPA: hypothetical protein PLW72_01495 [Burkholderiaceae bacterium]|nr:hypothetical protein [Burkholderiaceae bacterium]
MNPLRGCANDDAYPRRGPARGAKGARNVRVLAFATAFWALALGLLALDWVHSVPHNRFDEPLPWQLGHEKAEGAGHCAAPLK